MTRTQTTARTLSHWCSAAAVMCLLLTSSPTSAFGGVIYQYREVDTNILLATLEIASPPASSTSGWSTVDGADLLSLYLNENVFEPGLGNILIGSDVYAVITSLTGKTLDSGLVVITFPTIPGDPMIDRQFILDLSEDPVLSAFGFTHTYSDGSVVVGHGFFYGEFVVPEPGTLSLFALGLAGVLRQRTRAKL